MKKIFEKILKIDPLVWLWVAVAIFILWQMLLPGYVLSLDMIFGPAKNFCDFNQEILNNLPFCLVFSFFQVFLPVWLIQKFILLIIFFLIPYLAYKFLPLPDRNSRIFAGLIYLFNPFVYTRFLAGHWLLLFAYAFLPIFVYFFLKFFKDFSLKSALKLFLTLFLVSIFSIHFFVIVSLFLFFYFLGFSCKLIIIKKIKDFWQIIKNLSIGFLLFFIASSYWIFPIIFKKNNLSSLVNYNQWEAFAPVGYKGISVLLNLFSLNGFWGQNQIWGSQFRYFQDYGIFYLAFIVLLFLTILGVYYLIKNKKNYFSTIFLGAVFLLSFIFSTGIANTIFKNFNLYFYHNIFFWSVFRDSQKFIGVIVLGYAFLGGYGFFIISKFLKENKYWEWLRSFLFLIPLSLGFLMFFGFQGQLKSVNYPEGWQLVKRNIQNDQTDFKVLFLPWHGYLSLKFNHNLISANPAKIFFGSKIIKSQSVEVGEIYDQENDLIYRKLDNLITAKEKIPINEIIIYFKSLNIKYLILAKDLIDVDIWQYEFLQSEKLEKLFSDKDLDFYLLK